jgi:ubiquinone/menaquinone biosynthesis C-methylase UbiE
MNNKNQSNFTDTSYSMYHPRLDYRTEEAKKYTKWIDTFLSPYIRQGIRLIELGCGTGKQSFKAETLSAVVTGIDRSAIGIQKAEEIATAIGSSVSFIVGNFLEMPLDDDSFDIVLLHKAIVNLGYADFEKLAAEIRRILVKGGLFINTMREWSLDMENKEVDLLAGSQKDILTFPNVGEFEERSFHWTIGYANYIATKFLGFHNFTRMDEKSFLLCYKKY